MLKSQKLTNIFKSQLEIHLSYILFFRIFYHSNKYKSSYDLQKYRSHRKHLLAREAEAASWTQKRQMYGVAMGGSKGGANISPWYLPTMGFPPITTMHPPFRPLHVWGHPTMDPQARMPMWPKQVVPSAAPLPPGWAPPPPHPPPADPSFWHSSHQRVSPRISFIIQLVL